MVKKQHEINKIVNNFVTELSKKVSLDGVFLFGSAARGEMTRDSDLDLLVISKDFNAMNFMQRLQLLSRASVCCSDRIAIDAVGYTPKEFLCFKKQPSHWLRVIKKQAVRAV